MKPDVAQKAREQLELAEKADPEVIEDCVGKTWAEARKILMDSLLN